MSVRENSNETGRLHLDAKRLTQITPLSASIIDISARVSSERENVEAFIRDIYRESYDARIDITYPVLMSVRNDAGDILAATGFRYAGMEPLFLEHYTGAPIESVLSGVYATNIARQEIVEIGNLASAGNGASIFLFAALSAYLEVRGIRYATITGTSFLMRRLKKLGLRPQTICEADINLLPYGDRGHWGTYYDTQPRVLAGTVGDGVRHLQRRLGAVYEDCRTPLYPRLHFRENA